MAQKIEAKGRKGGNVWDDGTDHDNVTKIYVRGGVDGIQYVKFDYIKSGQPKSGSIHGLSARGFTQTFELNHKNEYLVSVSGYYDDATGVIQGLQFKTNLNTSEMMGYDDKGSRFSLGVIGKKIIGFHGYAETKVNSLGAYFTTAPPTKLDYVTGASGGNPFDDGVFDGVKKMYITQDKDCIRYIKIEYALGGKVETRAHGLQDGQTSEFVINYPDEFITSIEGTCNTGDPKFILVRSLIIKTSKGRISPTYGIVSTRKFVLESNGAALIGFHGRSGWSIDDLGAYFSPIFSSPPPPAEKLQAQGGEGGESWDDGDFDGLRKIYVGQGENGVAAVKFVYGKDSDVVEGNERGKKTLLGYEEFELDYPSEYITAVEGCYDIIIGSEGGVITMLKFKTNKRTSPQFGLESTSNFLLEKKGHKIVGFHGKASHELHQLGVHVVPITE